MFEMTPFIRGNHVLAAYDPFKEMEELENRFFGRQLPTFKTDIRETEQAYIVEADLPGFAKEDIHAEIKNGTLTVRAERKSEKNDSDESGKYIRRERTFGSYTRSFDLEGINSNDISASYRDGVLSLILPKAAPKQEEGRKLEIQ